MTKILRKNLQVTTFCYKVLCK